MTRKMMWWLAAVTVPVLQVVGSETGQGFADAARALDARLADGRVATIDGAKHAAHHSHPGAFLALIDRLLRA